MDRILNSIKKDDRISAAALAKQISVSERTVERDINKLKKSGKLKRVGGDKGGHWEIIKQ